MNMWHDQSLRGGIAAEFVRNNHAWAIPSGAQQLAEEPHGREAIPLWLD
jgi:hypothetical protein